MKSSTITAVGIFAVLVILLFLLPQTTRQQLQGALYQWISPILRTGASVQQELGGVRGGLKRLDELEHFSRQKSQSLILRHLGKAVFEQNQDFSEESNLCNTSIKRE